MPHWKEVPAPARKADYRHKHLRLLDTPPRQQIGYGPEGSYWKPELPVRAGDVVKVHMRRTAAETGHLCSVNDNGDMVRVTLSGQKTQTRRPVKPQPVWVIAFRRVEQSNVQS